MRAVNSGDGKMADVAKTRLLYGIVVLFAVFSLWGFVQLLRSFVSGTDSVTSAVEDEDLPEGSVTVGDPVVVDNDITNETPPLNEPVIPVDGNPVDVDPYEPEVESPVTCAGGRQSH